MCMMILYSCPFNHHPIAPARCLSQRLVKPLRQAFHTLKSSPLKYSGIRIQSYPRQDSTRHSQPTSPYLEPRASMIPNNSHYMPRAEKCPHSRPAVPNARCVMLQYKSSACRCPVVNRTPCAPNRPKHAMHSLEPDRNKTNQIKSNERENN